MAKHKKNRQTNSKVRTDYAAMLNESYNKDAAEATAAWLEGRGETITIRKGRGTDFYKLYIKEAK